MRSRARKRRITVFPTTSNKAWKNGKSQICLTKLTEIPNVQYKYQLKYGILLASGTKGVRLMFNIRVCHSHYEHIYEYGMNKHVQL